METLNDGAESLVVSVVAFKRAIGIFDEDTDQDAAFEAYLGAAQAFVETAARRPLSLREVAFSVDGCHWLKWWFPVAPVAQILQLADVSNGSEVVIDPQVYYLESAFDEPRLCLRSAIDGTSFRVTAQVGYEVGQCPKPLMQAIILIAKEWFDAGQAIEGFDPPVLNFGAKTLIRQKRYARPWEFIP